MIHWKSIILISGILIFPFVGARSQFDVFINQYWQVYCYYNPANAGQNNKLNIGTVLNINSMKLSHAPRSGILVADMPLNFWGQAHGVGVGVFAEGTGLFRNRQVWSQYSLKKMVGKGIWGFGIQGGILRVSINPENRNLGNNTGESEEYRVTTKSSKFDVAAGIMYSRPEFFLGVSGHHLTSPRIILGETDSLRVQPTVYFTAGYNILSRNPLFSMQPSVHLRTDFDSFRATLAGRFYYVHNRKTLSGCVAWSPDNSVSFGISANIRNITVGYTYELFMPKVIGSSGRHELLVSYSVAINRQKRNKYKHQSIRIL